VVRRHRSAWRPRDIQLPQLEATEVRLDGNHALSRGPFASELRDPTAAKPIALSAATMPSVGRRLPPSNLLGLELVPGRWGSVPLAELAPRDAEHRPHDDEDCSAYQYEDHLAAGVGKTQPDDTHHQERQADDRNAALESPTHTGERYSARAAADFDFPLTARR
jgi:hypothetical protein